MHFTLDASFLKSSPTQNRNTIKNVKKVIAFYFKSKGVSLGFLRFSKCSLKVPKGDQKRPKKGLYPFCLFFCLFGVCLLDTKCHSNTSMN